MKKIEKYIKGFIKKTLSAYRDAAYQEFPVTDEEDNILYYEICLPRGKKVIRGMKQIDNNKDSRKIAK